MLWWQYIIAGLMAAAGVTALIALLKFIPLARRNPFCSPTGAVKTVSTGTSTTTYIYRRFFGQCRIAEVQKDGVTQKTYSWFPPFQQPPQVVVDFSNGTQITYTLDGNGMALSDSRVNDSGGIVSATYVRTPAKTTITYTKTDMSTYQYEADYDGNGDLYQDGRTGSISPAAWTYTFPTMTANSLDVGEDFILKRSAHVWDTQSGSDTATRTYTPDANGRIATQTDSRGTDTTNYSYY